MTQCSLPLTGIRCVRKIVSDLAVLEVTDAGFVLLERAPGVSIDFIKERTEGSMIIKGDVPEIIF